MSQSFGEKGQQTKQHLFHTALELFRRKGFHATSMRDIAQESGMALGAAYRYFPSKDHFIQTYYEWMQTEHEKKFAAACPKNADFVTKLELMLSTKLAILSSDQKLLAALFSFLGDQNHPLSLFGSQNQNLRQRSIAQFQSICSKLPLTLPMKKFVGHSLWFLHIGVLLYFVYDDSLAQKKTNALVKALVGLSKEVMPLLAHPLFRSFSKLLFPKLNQILHLLGLDALSNSMISDPLTAKSVLLTEENV